MKTSLDLEKEQVITPAWMKEIDDIKHDIAFFEEQQLVNEQDKQRERSASPQSVAEIDIIEDDQASLLNDRYKIDNQI